MALPILQQGLYRIVGQTIGHAVGGELRPIVATDTPALGAEPQMALPILQQGPHATILDQTVIAGEGCELSPIVTADAL
jgi:hypothetical protein